MNSITVTDMTFNLGFIFSYLKKHRSIKIADVSYTKYQSFVGTTINVDIYDDEKITDLEEDLIYPVVYYFDNMVHSHE